MPRPLNPSDYVVASYEDFRERAADPKLSLNEKCGFSDVFRAGFNTAIMADLCSKVTALSRAGARICDIGAGCSELSQLIIETTRRNGQSLTVIDSPEMLKLLPDYAHITKIEGPFPDCLGTVARSLGPFDGILTYSVLQTVFLSGNLFAFVDAAIELLVEGGQFLIGDIPNATMRKRFIVSEAGKAYHQLHYAHLPEPKVEFNTLNVGEIDDGVILGLIARARSAGLHAFALPQGPELPMATRREDILIVRP